MRKRWVVLLSFAGVIVGFFVWVSRPEPSDRAELTDTCSFPTITNAQYRALVTEAKKLIEPNRRRIANGDGNIEQGTSNPPLRDLVQEFVKRSRSTEETFVRLFAFGRALDGRVEDTRHDDATFAGPWGSWVNRGSAGEILSSPRFVLGADFQGPPGLFRYPMSTWVLARLLGRRYENFRLTIWFDPPADTRLDDALTGSHVVDAYAFKAFLIYPWFDIAGGNIRREQRCPSAERFLSHANGLLKKRKS